ncbi:hypothetical protein NDU88_000504 [Pleurodeles waltl]|uniref:Uncharacterized protein n=1 Tax=Pleurodeles waltl TaxID=8319 RepID=A0AAV7LX08_PLEWA|nr:hypothetical protein NDU88_000504 [Pleurodeles waltl]
MWERPLLTKTEAVRPPERFRARHGPRICKHELQSAKVMLSQNKSITRLEAKRDTTKHITQRKAQGHRAVSGRQPEPLGGRQGWHQRRSDAVRGPTPALRQCRTGRQPTRGSVTRGNAGLSQEG